jgi:hypothetical protein
MDTTDVNKTAKLPCPRLTVRGLVPAISVFAFKEEDFRKAAGAQFEGQVVRAVG